MRINGEWKLCDDDVVRPVIRARVLSSSGDWLVAEFLMDTGADRTVFNARTLGNLSLPSLASEEEISGLGGVTGSALVETKLNLPRENGAPVIFTSRFTAVTDPTALDLCILGRDIMDLFAVIVDRPGNVVCLISQKHRYTIIQD
ncbi:MAG: protease [Acidobacteriota bacterium]|nr:protease [Acidobacteriota bacterium]